MTIDDVMIGEIRLFPYMFTPEGFLACQGQSVQVALYAALFSVLGTRYGSADQDHFNLPDLRNYAAMGSGTGAKLTPRSVGQKGGEDAVVLDTGSMPAHTHKVSIHRGRVATDIRTYSKATPAAGDWVSYPENVGSAITNVPAFVNAAPNTLMAPMLGATGGNAPHENRQPFLTMHFCIAVEGDYPLRP